MIFNYLNKKIYRLNLRRYVKKNLKKGHKIKDIRKKLVKKVKNKKYVDKLIDDVVHRKLEKRVIIFLVIFLFLSGAGYFYFNQDLDFRRSVGMSMPTKIYSFCDNFFWENKKSILSDEVGLIDFRNICYSLFGIQKQSKFYTPAGRDQIINWISAEGTKECGLSVVGISRSDTPIRENELLVSVNWYQVKNITDLEKVYRRYRPGERAVIHTPRRIVITEFIQIKDNKTSLGLKFEQAYCVDPQKDYEKYRVIK